MPEVPADDRTLKPRTNLTNQKTEQGVNPTPSLPGGWINQRENGPRFPGGRSPHLSVSLGSALLLASEADHDHRRDRAQEEEAQDGGGNLVEDARGGVGNLAAGRGRIATQDALGRAGTGRLAL